MKRIFIILIILILLILVFFISTKTHGNKNNFKNEDLSISVSNYALKSMTEQIVGDKIEVIEAYDFKTEIHQKTSLTAIETQNILQTDLFITISPTFESYVNTIKEAVKNGQSNVEVIQMSDYYEDELLDEHIFISPKQAIKMNNIIYEQIIKLDPQNKDYYTKNYNEAKTKLKNIDEQYQYFADENTKTIYAEHDAYYWLREDYDLDIVGIHGKSHESEISSKHIEEIIKDINSDNTHIILAENKEEVDSVLKTIQKETNVSIEIINNLEINNGLNYLDIYQNNLNTMKRVG